MAPELVTGGSSTSTSATSTPSSTSTTLFSQINTSYSLSNSAYIKGKGKASVRLNTSILSLPATAISEIFFQLTLRQWVEYTEADRSWLWFTVGHVCRLWWKIALENQVLWSYIPTSTLRMDGVKAFLARSGKTVLRFRHEYIDFASETQNHIPELEFALQHLYRTEELIIIGDFPKLYDIGNISTFLRAPTPCLKRLEIVSNIPFFSHFVIPVTFFEGADLRHLTLMGLTMEWNSFPYRNLKEIVLGRTFDFQPTLREMYQILQQSPNLEVLKL